jgi:hypothetical protein
MSIAALPLGEPSLAQQLANGPPAKPPLAAKRTIVANRDTVARPEPR